MLLAEGESLEPVAQRVASALRELGFVDGEGQDVGRARLASIALVQFTELGIVGEHQGEFGSGGNLELDHGPVQRLDDALGLFVTTTVRAMVDQDLEAPRIG